MVRPEALNFEVRRRHRVGSSFPMLTDFSAEQILSKPNDELLRVQTHKHRDAYAYGC